MRTRHHLSAVVVGGWFSLLAGCGGVDTSGSPTLQPGMTCSGDSFKSAGTCVPFSVCQPGQYVVSEATGTSDRMCAPCPGETFSTTTNSPLCSPLTICQPGAYVAGAPSPAMDRLCSPCALGTYTAGVNQSICLGPDDCPAGTMETAPGTATGARICTPCEPGTYCAGGATIPVPCASEQWDSDADPATQCVPKTVCGSGTRIARLGSATVDRSCTVCPGGTFSTAENATGCAPWRNCPPGTYVANIPTPSSDRGCIPCAAGTFTTGENQSTCSAMDVCPAGTTETAPRTATTGPQCTPCSPGQYCVGGSLPPRPCGADQTWDHDGDPTTACLAWSVCQAGYQVSSQGTPTTNRVCDACPDGTFADTNNQSACQPWTTCPANRAFIGSPGTSSKDVVCRPCSEVGCPTYCALDGTCLECADHRDCAAGLSCVDGTCKDLGCGADDHYFLETFISGPIAQFWTLSGEWEAGPAIGTSAPGSDPATDHTLGPDNMLAGVVIGGNLAATTMSEPAYLTSAPFDTSFGPSPVYLEFYRWLNSGVAPAMSNTVEVWDGSTWRMLWSGPVATPVRDSEWSQEIFDVTAYRNPYFRVRFGYLVAGAGADAWSSWNIDDVRVANTYSCPTPIM